MENEIIELEETKKLSECGIGRILHKDTEINWNSGGGVVVMQLLKSLRDQGD